MKLTKKQQTQLIDEIQYRFILDTHSPTNITKFNGVPIKGQTVSVYGYKFNVQEISAIILEIPNYDLLVKERDHNRTTASPFSAICLDYEHPRDHSSYMVVARSKQSGSSHLGMEATQEAIKNYRLTYDTMTDE